MQVVTFLHSEMIVQQHNVFCFCFLQISIQTRFSCIFVYLSNSVLEISKKKKKSLIIILLCSLEADYFLQTTRGSSLQSQESPKLKMHSRGSQYLFLFKMPTSKEVILWDPERKVVVTFVAHR